MTRVRVTGGHRPDVEGTGVLVPATLVRGGVLVAGAVLVLLLVAGRPAGAFGALLGGFVVLCACAPGSAAVTALGLLTVWAQLSLGAADLRALGTALALYVTWLVCGLAAAVPVSGHVELAALAPSLRRLAVVGGVTAAVALASAVARAGGVRVGEDGLLVVGLVVLAAGAVLAVALVRAAGHR